MRALRKSNLILATVACATAIGGIALMKDVEVTPVKAYTEAISLVNGGSIRVSSQENRADIRFTVQVHDTSILSNDLSSVGVIVATHEENSVDEILTDDNFVLNASDGMQEGLNVKWMKVDSREEGFSYNESNNTFSVVITGVPMANYNQKFAVRAYVWDGSVYSYTPFTVTDNSRAISYVAREEILDESEGGINDTASAVYKYRPQVLNMMGNKLVTGTTDIAGDLSLVDGDTSIKIGTTTEAGTYSFAYNAGEYALQLEQPEAIDYEYALSVLDANVEKNLAKLPFYMYTAPNQGGSKYDVSERLGWYNNTGAAKTAYLTVKENGNLKIDGSTAVEGKFSSPRLQVTLTDPQFWDNYFYQVIYDHTFTTIPGSTDGKYTLAVGTQNYYKSWKNEDQVIQTMPYLAQETGRTAMEGKVRATFAFDGDPVGYGGGKSVPSNLLNLLWLRADNLSATGLQAEITPFSFQRLGARSEFTWDGHTISMGNYFGLSGDVSVKYRDSSAWNNGTTLNNGNIGHVASGQTPEKFDAAVMGVNAYQFLKWKSSDENYIKVVVTDGHSLEYCKNKSCWGHYTVVRGSTATDKKVTLEAVLQIDDGPEYPVVRRIFNPTATTDTTTTTATDFKTAHWKKSAHVTNGTVDFAVQSASSTPRILQLTDTQVVDGSQAENTGNSAVVPAHYSYQTLSRIDTYSFDAVQYAINASNPDLIIITGDLIYGQFDHTGAAWTKVVNYMESFGIPWAPIFGNHEIESNKGVDWQCEQLANAKHCLFNTRDIRGSGNYTVGIVNSSDQLLRVFYMMDTNGNYNASATSKENAYVSNLNGWGEDQFTWFTEDVAKVKAAAPTAKLSLAIHIPIMAFNTALTQYGYNGETEQYAFQVDIDTHANKQDGDFGYIHTTYSNYYWDSDNRLWNLLKDNGFDSVFSGHIHENSASVVYEGIRLTFGLKSSVYDSTLWKNSDGTLVKSNTDEGDPVIGGTQFVLGSDGSISSASHLYFHALDGVYIKKL